VKKYWAYSVVLAICVVFTSVIARNPFAAALNAKKGDPASARVSLNPGDEISQKNPDADTRWASFENPLAVKGGGATENQGAKGHPFDSLDVGETKTLFHAKGSGEIRRMWFTLNEPSPETLRSLHLQIYWDGASSPAVSVPFGDFFLAMMGRPVAFENALFANPEGRSFVCYVPMPFRTEATVTITNESTRKIPYLFYDVDALQTKNWNSDSLYFHATWRREARTTLGRDFEILPKVEGEGRYIGAHVGVIVNQENMGWWGEGEAKVYLDGDSANPTLAGTGTEDYIGTGWGQGVFLGRYQGSILVDSKRQQYGFYRYHIPDPIYFHHDIRVTISQLGGENRSGVQAMLKKGVAATPVTMDDRGKWIKLKDAPNRDFMDYKTASPDPGTVYARQDDVSAVALYYLDSAGNSLKPIAPVAERIQGLATPEELSKQR